MTISRSVLLRVRNVSEKFVQKIETHILCSVTFSPENRAIYEIMWENIVGRVRPQMAIWRMRIESRIPKDTNKLSEYNYCFPTATVVLRTRRDVNHMSTLPVL